MAGEGEGRTALITGASRGIGRAMALGLARAGFDVIVTDIERQRSELDGVRADIEALGRRAWALIGDVSNKADVTAMIGTAIEAAGRIDAVVNNAGILIANSVEQLEEAQWDAVMDVNAKGVFLVTQALLPHMRANRYGRVVNIASIGGKHGAPRQAHYSASKAAVMGFTRVLAQEVGVDGITANCICPGIVVTDMGRVNLTDPKLVERWTEGTALRRLSEPDDMVGAVVFFASDMSAFVTGQSLNVDGGINFS